MCAQRKGGKEDAPRAGIGAVETQDRKSSQLNLLRVSLIPGPIPPFPPPHKWVRSFTCISTRPNDIISILNHHEHDLRLISHTCTVTHARLSKRMMKLITLHSKCIDSVWMQASNSFRSRALSPRAIALIAPLMSCDNLHRYSNSSHSYMSVGRPWNNESSLVEHECCAPCMHTTTWLSVPRVMIHVFDSESHSSEVPQSVATPIHV